MPLEAGGERRLRIAAHNGAPEWGGAEIATSLLLQGLQERGHQVVLYHNRSLVARHAVRYGLEVRRAYLGGDVALHHALRFAVQLRRLRPDALIVGTFRKLWLAAVAARLAGVPVVTRIGLSTDLPRNLKYRVVFRRFVARVITNADDITAAYRRALPEAPPPIIRTIHKGIRLPPPRRSREETLDVLDLPAGVPVVGGVGRLVEQKRFDRLLEAFAFVPPPARLVVVGDGPLRPELETLARD
ncbi:MAG: glycosyltransferase, partial [Gemmatimonadota bacterium]